VAEVTLVRPIALALLLCAGTAGAAPLQEALDAIKGNDCGRLGEVLNRHLDGNTAVQYLAGVIHEEAICVDRDLERAARYYAAADGRRDATAARDIALVYLRGGELPRSYARAGAWLGKMYAWRRDGVDEVKLPRSIVALPAASVDPASEWAGYLVGVGFVGSHTMQYPKDALRNGIEGSFKALVCVADGTVNATTVTVEPGPIAGTAAVRGRRQLLDAIEENYATVMKTMPPPPSPAPAGLCFRQPIVFRIR
jgi:TPR repeat protein